MYAKQTCLSDLELRFKVKHQVLACEDKSLSMYIQQHFYFQSTYVFTLLNMLLVEIKNVLN